MIPIVRAMGRRGGAYSAAVLADSPLAYWRLGEASGNFADSSGNGRTATKAGTITHDVNSLLPSDKSNRAISLAGAGWASGAANVNPTAITLEAWVRFTSLATGPSIVYRDTGVAGNRIFQFRVESTGEIRLTIWTTGGGPFTASSATGVIAINTTYHVAATYNNANMIVYVNKTAVKTQAQTGNLASGTGSYWFGADTAAGHAVSGTIDEVAIYPTALSSARISAHYDAA